MNTKVRRITVGGLCVEVVRKDIKHLHLGVYPPPHGRVCVSAPLVMSHDAVRMAVIGKLSWIKKQQAKFDAQPRQSQREMVNGESHYFLGQRYSLRVREHHGLARVGLRGTAFLDLYVRPETTAEQRERILQQWYRGQLKALIPPLLEKWQPVIGVQVADWGVKKMKTRWGTCNIVARRIWFNLELAKKPVQCLEYIAVHELVHLLERHHNDRFQALMDQFMPKWHLYRDGLNQTPLGHDRPQLSATGTPTVSHHPGSPISCAVVRPR
ncbi:MAG: M48 family metallopeptidase [Acidobacteriales bacterium]|nr:M48 family metallopeptidase [Terriglobales bacterium]